MNPRKRIVFFGCFLFLFLLVLPVSAEQADHAGTALESTGFSAPALLKDKNERTYTATSGEASVTLTNSAGIGSVYIVFDKIPSPWTITDGTQTFTCGENGFLHEFTDVQALFGDTPTSLVLTFPGGTSVDEIYGFTAGELPGWVQIWLPPCAEADLLLFSSHSDDEQLFFAGILPLYAVERDLAVQVVYIVNHFDTYNRPHEQLDGLWAVGVRHYPIIPAFPDLYSESLEGAISAYASRGYSYEDFCQYITDCLRRFRPQVVISHDIEGEYGHGTHILCTAALMDSLLYANDPVMYPESAQMYGTWDVPKTYLHLYTENQIVLDLDVPLESFGGKTAFQVTQDGFAHHKSQHWTWFYKWIYGTTDAPITKAAQINYLSPCRYGLYRSTVGADVIGGDFFENLTSYAQQAAIREEEAKETETLPETEETAPVVSVVVPETEEETEKNPPDIQYTAPDRELSPVIFVLLGGIAFILFLVIFLHVFMYTTWKKKRKQNKRRRK
ncbi:MAG: PIG-L family deacetylase [Clostridia bacterium]|nr:PIG-L family deacetylase [Clostridia bacterium]